MGPHEYLWPRRGPVERLPPLRAAWVLALVLLLPGCAKPAEPPTPGGGAGASLPFVAPVAVGVGGPEPVVAIAADDGTIYVAAQDFQKASAIASRSDDGGVTFLARGSPWDAQREPGLTNGNLVAAGSHLFLPYVCRDGNAVCIATSEDRGASWSQRVLAARSV